MSEAEPVGATDLPASQTAGFWIRTRAYLIDAILLALVGGAPFLLSSAQRGVQYAQGAGGDSGLIPFLYFVFCWSHFGGGRTLGMRVFGLRVVREDGAALSLWTSVVRYFGLLLSVLAFFAGVLWVARDARHQGWHDKLAHTLVVLVEQEVGASGSNVLDSRHGSGGQ